MVATIGKLRPSESAPALGPNPNTTRNRDTIYDLFLASFLLTSTFFLFPRFASPPSRSALLPVLLLFLVVLLEKFFHHDLSPRRDAVSVQGLRLNAVLDSSRFLSV